MAHLDQARKKSNGKMLDILFDYAGECHVENTALFMAEADDEDEGEGEQISPSPQFEQRMKKIFRSYERTERLKRVGRKIGKIMFRAAIILLILGGSLGIVTTVSEAAKVKIFNFFIDTKDKFTDIYFKEQEITPTEAEKRLKKWHDAYIPTYIPEGFKVVKAEDLGLIKAIGYDNSNGKRIEYNYSSIETSSLQVDTENAKVENIVLNHGEECMLIEKNGFTSLVWHNNEMLFYLRVNLLDRNEAMKMAESIKLRK